MMKSNQIRFWALFAVLIAGGALTTIWERVGEARVGRESLAGFPRELGAWRQRGADERFGKEVEDVLRADDYLSRTYVLLDAQAASLYVGYHASQRVGATYHSPLNCLPGSGWALTEPARSLVTPASGAPAFEANRYIIERGGDRQLLLYWYQGRGRAIASEYKDKIHTVLDSAMRRRSDGAMVRVLVPVPVGKSEAETIKIATDLAAQVAPALPRYVPN